MLLNFFVYYLLISYLVKLAKNNVKRYFQSISSPPRKNGKLVKLQPQKPATSDQSRWKNKKFDYSDNSSDDEGIGSASTSLKNSLPGLISLL